MDFFSLASMSKGYVVCPTDCDRTVWRKAIQLLPSEFGEVDVVCLSRARRTGLGSGNTNMIFAFTTHTAHTCNLTPKRGELFNVKMHRLFMKIHFNQHLQVTFPKAESGLPLFNSLVSVEPGDLHHSQQQAEVPARCGAAHPEGRDARGGAE